MRIAIIITAFNRKEKTLNCIKRIFNSSQSLHDLKVYLTDDGSTDDTTEAVKTQFPQVIISKGNGNLFWSGGTNLSWSRAIREGKFDGYLWLNDDTIINDNLWQELQDTEIYSRKTYNVGGIYVGATTSMDGLKLTYSGSVNASKWRSKFVKIPPNGDFQECEVANGNITYISHDVVARLGCIYSKYVHGGDYDYTYKAHKEGFPILLMRNYVGKCDNDHKNPRSILINLSIKERIRYLYSPIGFQLKTALLFQKRFFPHYVPLLFISYWFKTLFPWVLKK